MKRIGRTGTISTAANNMDTYASEIFKLTDADCDTWWGCVITMQCHPSNITYDFQV